VDRRVEERPTLKDQLAILDPDSERAIAELLGE